MNELLRAGIATTNDYHAVRLRVWGGDADRDGDVDMLDFSAFADCLGGPAEPAADCAAFDVDENGAVDLRDFAEILQLFTSSDS